MSAKGTVLIVEDQICFSDPYKKQLLLEGYHVEVASNIAQAKNKLKVHKVDVVLLDLRLPPRGRVEDGLDLLIYIKSLSWPIKVIIVTGASDPHLDLRCIELGADDFVLKGSNTETVLPFRVNQAYDSLRRERELTKLREKKLEHEEGFPCGQGQFIVGTSPEMRAVYRQIQDYAPVDTTVLIVGETGTGKDLVARAIHHHSRRRQNPFVSISCAAIPESLFESTLFGHEKGAFTGASSTEAGIFRCADGGTVFLDDLNTMPIEMQSKLLRAIEQKEIRPVGGQATKVDVRIVAAMNTSPAEAIRSKELREDIYYRLRISLKLPALRERQSDISILAEHFRSLYETEHGKHTLGFSVNALEHLVNYEWPGNVRQLAGVIETAVIGNTGKCIDRDELALNSGRPNYRQADPSVTKQTLADILDTAGEEFLELDAFTALAQAEYIETVLEAVQYNRTKAANILGINPTTLWRKRRKIS